MEKMERVQDLVTLTLFLFYKTCSVKSRKFTVDMISFANFASKKGKLMIESLVNIVLKHTKRSKLLARRNHKSFIHSYEFSCNSTPQSSQPFRSRIKRNGYKFLPCLSGKALDVESESVVILPRDMMRHSDPVLAIEGPQNFNSSMEQLQTCDDELGALLPIEGPYSPVAAGSMEDAFNGSGPIFAIDSMWSPIRSKDENFAEPDIDWLAEEFIRSFYQKLREQIF